MFTCQRCHYEWESTRSRLPKQCPKCHIKNWQVPYSTPNRINSGHHGCTHHRLYHVWNSMMRRCYQPHHPAYKWYGQRGIVVEHSWHDPRNFINDMDATYTKGLSLDRINNEGEYSKDNCRWATSTEQTRNTRRNNYITLRGKTKPLCDWLEIYGICKPTYAHRRRLGWDIVEAIITPVKKKTV